MIKIQDLMQTSGVVFGSSGTRGLVVQMTDEVCVAYVSAFLTVLTRSFNFERVALLMRQDDVCSPFALSLSKCESIQSLRQA